MKKNFRIAFISTMMPTPTNLRGPSSLPYQLIAHRPDGITVDIFTMNQNGVSAEAIDGYSKRMKSQVTIVTPSFFYKICNTFGLRWLLCRYRRLPFKTLIRLSPSIVSYINDNSDYIWLYPHFLLGVARQFSRPIIVTGPDSSALYCERCLCDSFAIRSMGFQNIKRVLQREKLLELCWSSLHKSMLHFVGEDDYRYFMDCNPRGNAFYLRHPSNMPEGLTPKQYEHTNNKLSIVITGELNIYTHSDMEIILGQLCRHSRELNEKYRFTFIGKKWNDIVTAMMKYGYQVVHKEWVEDYFRELKLHDLQLFPISVGTGTKGKVLDALCAGIVCLGSKYAFENIQLIDGVSAYKYEKAQEIGEILIKIYNERNNLASIATAGHDVVCKDHAPAVIAKDFFNHFNI